MLWHRHGRSLPAHRARTCRPGPRPPGQRAPAAGDLPRPALAVQRPAIVAVVRPAARRAADGPGRAEHGAGQAGLAGLPGAAAAGHPARRSRRHDAGLPADFSSGQPDIRGGHPALLLAVPCPAGSHAADRPAAQPRRAGRDLVADPAADLGGVVAAGGVRRAVGRRRSVHGAAAARRGSHSRAGWPGERPRLVRPDRRNRPVRRAGSHRAGRDGPGRDGAGRDGPGRDGPGPVRLGPGRAWQRRSRPDWRRRPASRRRPSTGSPRAPWRLPRSSPRSSR